MIAKTLSTSAKFAGLYERAGKLAEFCQSLYPLLVAHSDDFGRLQGDPFTVKHLVLPISPRTVDAFAQALTALDAVGLIAWYESDGRKYIQIEKFEPHQTGLHKRTDSEFPAPPGSSGNFPAVPPEQKGREEKGTEGKGAAAPPSPAALLRIWNGAVQVLPHADKLTDSRERHARARLRECPDLDEWRAVFLRMDASPFCQGVTGRGTWRADFDFALKPDTRVRVLEGKYDDHRAGPAFRCTHQHPPPNDCRDDAACTARYLIAQRGAPVAS